MIYANRNRKKMARMYPLESNKDISKRLGNSWKQLTNEEKSFYYNLAKEAEAEHRRKYPGTVQNKSNLHIFS